MSHLAGFLISAAGLACVVAAGALWLWACPRSAAPRRLLLLIGVLYVLATISAVSYAVEALFASEYIPLTESDVPRGSSAIVLLGANGYTARNWDDAALSVLGPDAAERVLEAARVFRLAHASWIISSGGLTAANAPGREPSGLTMRNALVQLGVPPERILTETRSTTTHDEAVLIRPMLASLPVDHVILVTSRVHMRRSMGTFRAAGITAIPAIARDVGDTVPWSERFTPSEFGLDYANAVAHEIIGIGYYQLRGWYR